MTGIRDMLAALREMDPQLRLRWGMGIALLLALALLYSFINSRVDRLERRRMGREAELTEMLVLKQRFQEAKAGAQRVANRLTAVRAGDTPARLIEESGIKGKSLQVKPLKSEERNGLQEESADVRIEGLTVNEAVNLVFRLEQGERPAGIRRALFKTRFEDPSRLDLAMTVTLQKGAVPR